MSEVLGLIQEHGELFYLITFFWTALEGESFVIFAALAAQRGLLSIELLFLAAWLGSFCGDQAYFYIGRNFGSWILRRFPKIETKLSKVFSWVEYNSTLFILTYRFMYGIRNISSVALGMSKLSWLRFLWLNCLAAAIWAGSFCSFGYFFSYIMGRFSKQHEQVVEHGIVYELTISAAVLFVVILGVRWISRMVREAVLAKRQGHEASNGHSICCETVTERLDAEETSQK